MSDGDETCRYCGEPLYGFAGEEANCPLKPPDEMVDVGEDDDPLVLGDG